MSATDDRIDRLTAIIGKGGLYDQMARILDSLDRSAKVALARELALAAAGYAVVRWPPTGGDVQRCADEVNPYAATAEQYSLTVETVCDVIATWMRLAAAAQERKA